MKTRWVPWGLGSSLRCIATSAPGRGGERDRADVHLEDGGRRRGAAHPIGEPCFFPEGARHDGFAATAQTADLCRAVAESRRGYDIAVEEMRGSFGAEGFREGVAHFLGKRAAAFTGR